MGEHDIPVYSERAMQERIAQAVRAERGRLATVISPETFRELADWFDTDGALTMRVLRAGPSHSLPWTWEVGDWQDDLRRFTGLLES